MKRTALLSGLFTLLFMPRIAVAASPLTIISVTSDNGDSDIEEEAEDKLSGALLKYGISVADSSAIEQRYREEGRAAIVAYWGGAAMAWESISWVEHVYHARRLLAARLIVTDSSLPYGQFEVHQVKTRLSYKCFDVSTHRIITAGSYSEKGRGEDVSDVTDSALNSAVQRLAANAAYRLKH